MNINKKILIKIISVIWIILWINFILRDLFKKRYFYDYSILIKRDAEGRKSYTYGDYLYTFLKFSKYKIPEKRTYGLVGIEDYSIEHRRAVYYLYPLIQTDNPDFILVYNKSGYEKKGYKFFASLDSRRFILKKI